MTEPYIIILAGRRIGTTALEMGDPPMGVVVGIVDFDKPVSGYQLFLSHCQSAGIRPNEDSPGDRYIDTPAIPALEIQRPDGVVISGLGTCVQGFDDDRFQVTVFGISYPFYEEEFPHHCQTYRERF